MCEHCGPKTPEERRILIVDADHIRGKLLALSDYYRLVARGELSPHSEVSGRMSAIAKGAIRRLVEDWV